MFTCIIVYYGFVDRVFPYCLVGEGTKKKKKIVRVLTYHCLLFQIHATRSDDVTLRRSYGTAKFASSATRGTAPPDSRSVGQVGSFLLSASCRPALGLFEVPAVPPS